MNDTNAEDPDLETIEEFATFQTASTDFTDSATTLMTAAIRMQMLMLDEARLSLSEMANMLSGAVRERRDRVSPEE